MNVSYIFVYVYVYIIYIYFFTIMHAHLWGVSAFHFQVLSMDLARLHAGVDAFGMEPSLKGRKQPPRLSEDLIMSGFLGWSLG